MSTLLRPRDLGGLAEWYASDPARWPVRPEFDPAGRWYARLAAPSDHEVWLLTWLPGQSTDLHDHGGVAGAFTVLDGQLTEQTPTSGPDVRLAARAYGAGATRRFGAQHVHRIVNSGNLPAVSVHVYSPVLTRMTRYTIEHGELRIRAVEQAGRDW
ncbi:MAG: cysteine dioxygenase [Actinobacteria bacterium 13_2_20CM_2_71_6]|nr:MAG: cysteine dioxygenase [Actinobacteria bacterium 13_2_20CM_2_71_6]